MGEDSKKRQELKRQIVNKAQSAPIELVENIASVLNFPKRWQLVERVATIPTGLEAQKFIISFDYLNSDECLFDQFDPTKGRKLIQILERVAKCEIAKFPELNLVRDSVGRIPPYESLFSKLTKEVDQLQETELCGGRIFFFITEPFFHIVSIETKHRDIYK